MTTAHPVHLSSSGNFNNHVVKQLQFQRSHDHATVIIEVARDPTSRMPFISAGLEILRFVTRDY